MRILVTGVTGQIGGSLASRLSETSTVIAADRTVLDLTRTSEIPGKLAELAPDVIVNPAAYTAVDRAEDERELAFVLNSHAPAVLARWAAEHGVPIVHFSTDYVFSGAGGRPWLETDDPGPLSTYGESKLAGELAVRNAGGSHLVVRTSWVYSSSGGNFLTTIVRLAKERRELRIVADQVGAPTSVKIIVDIVSSALTRPADLTEFFAGAGGLIHLSASGATSWHGFATAIVDGLHARKLPLAVERIVPIATEEYPTKARRPLNSRLDLSRLSQSFGVVPPQWSHGLERELDQIAMAGHNRETEGGTH